MYMKRMLEIGQASNGYVIECRVPIKPKEKKSSEKLCCEYPGSCEKQYIAKDAAEVVKIIEKLMPMLDDKFTSEEEFDAAFDKAAK